MKFKVPKTKKYRQGGMASIVVVLIIIVVISMISLGFARLMDRATRQATANNLGAAADFAALSGVNQASAYIKAHINDPTPVSSSTCNGLTGPGQPLENLSNLSGNGNVEYTCVLISSSVNDLLYKPVPAYRSQVTKLVTTPVATPMSRLMVSWQSSDATFNSSPAAGTTTLLDETTWGQNKYQPMLKITLFPIPAANSLISAVTPKSFYLYPNNIAGTNVQAVSYTATADGATIAVDCNGAGTVASTGTNFNGLADYKCNLILNSMPASAFYYAQLTPLYGPADVKLQANDAAATPNKLQFSGVQYLVDVTAKANNAVKRLQARIDTGGGSTNIDPLDNAISEYALRTANTICKRATYVSPTYTGAGPPCNVNYGTAGSYILTVSVKGGPNADNKVTGTGIDCSGIDSNGRQTNKDCTEPFAAGTQVTLTAVPQSNSAISSWTGCTSTILDGKGNPQKCIVNMDTTKLVKATFGPG